MRIGPQELIIVLIIVLVIFGPKNLPKLGKMFGEWLQFYIFQDLCVKCCNTIDTESVMHIHSWK